jgi:hypothetical protein
MKKKIYRFLIGSLFTFATYYLMELIMNINSKHYHTWNTEQVLSTIFLSMLCCITIIYSLSFYLSLFISYDSKRETTIFNGKRLKIDIGLTPGLCIGAMNTYKQEDFAFCIGMVYFNFVKKSINTL